MKRLSYAHFRLALRMEIMGWREGQRVRMKMQRNAREKLTGMSDANVKQSIRLRATPSCCATFATRVLLPEKL